MATKKTWLVGGIPTPLKNLSSSVGMVIPNIWKNKSHVPNHQPEKINGLVGLMDIGSVGIFRNGQKNMTSH